MSKGPLSLKPDYVVCTCMGVMYSEIQAQIDAGIKTFDEMREILMVGTGCSSCQTEIEEIMSDSIKRSA